MQYFELKADVEPKVIGLVKGIRQLTGSDLYLTENQWHKEIFHVLPRIDRKNWWKNWASYKQYAAHPLVGLELQKKGKLTDYMEFNIRGFYVSEKLKNILEESHLPPHVFQPTVITSLKTGEPIHGYYWFAYDYDWGDETIDFSKSEFTTDKHEAKYGKKFTVNSYDDYINVFYETGEALSARKIVFNQNFDWELDLVAVQFMLTRTYISERLLKKWQGAGIIGYIARSPEVVKASAEKFNDIYSELVFE